MTRSGPEGSLFGALEGMGTSRQTFWRHVVLSDGPLGVLGSILGALGGRLGPFGDLFVGVWSKKAAKVHQK